MKGRKVEVQLRTNVQHAWATSVEIADLVFDSRIKFEDDTGQYGEFFRICSEILARTQEDSNSCLPDEPAHSLKNRFEEIEKELEILGRLTALREQGDFSKIKQHTVLAFHKDGSLEIVGFRKAQKAIEYEGEMMNNSDFRHVVYVSASTPAAIKNSYRNYLTNASEFVTLINDGLTRL